MAGKKIMHLQGCKLGLAYLHKHSLGRTLRSVRETLVYFLPIIFLPTIELPILQLPTQALWSVNASLKQCPQFQNQNLKPYGRDKHGPILWLLNYRQLDVDRNFGRVITGLDDDFSKILWI